MPFPQQRALVDAHVRAQLVGIAAATHQALLQVLHTGEGGNGKGGERREEGAERRGEEGEEQRGRQDAGSGIESRRRDKGGEERGGRKGLKEQTVERGEGAGRNGRSKRRGGRGAMADDVRRRRVSRAACYGCRGLTAIGYLVPRAPKLL